MRVDLHLHTTFSDGILDPESLVSLVRRRGVSFFSITDHDCLDGLPIARVKAEQLGIQLVNGVELNTEFNGTEVHILGYRFDATDREFEQGLLIQRRDRELRFKKMLDKLNELGFELDEKRVFQLAGHGSIGRPHLALALIEKKLVKSVEEAFRKYLGHGRPAWVSRAYWTPQFAISAVRKAGGVAVLAHPERGGRELVAELAKNGLGGIEVYYPHHTPRIIRDLQALAEEHNLFMTVGSDYHGINPGEKGPGSVDAPQEVIEKTLRILRERSHG